MSAFSRIKRWFGGKTKAKAPEPEPTGDSSTFTEDRRSKSRISARKGTRVLIVDDSATIVALLSRMLKQNAFETFEAVDAEQGIALAHSERPDLIFLDIVLPGMDGFAALRLLRRDPLTKPMPVIMISGNQQATEHFYAQRIGADDFIKKPFSRADVFDAIERLLDTEFVPRRRGLGLQTDEAREPEADSA